MWSTTRSARAKGARGSDGAKGDDFYIPVVIQDGVAHLQTVVIHNPQHKGQRGAKGEELGKGG